MGNREWGIGNGESGMGNRESVISDELLGIANNYIFPMPCLANAQFPMPNSQFPIPNSQLK